MRNYVIIVGSQVMHHSVKSFGIIGFCLLLVPALLNGQTSEKAPREVYQANGSFEVSLKPLDSYNSAKEAMTGRMSLDKSFEGDLAGTSKGEMLTGMTAVKGSAGYVAIERVTGILNGRKGSFTLQHSGTMTRGVPSLTITVIPDSGTDELSGLEGSLSIRMEDKEHYYLFEYSLPKMK